MPIFKVGDFVLANINRYMPVSGEVVDVDDDDDYLEICLKDGSTQIVRKSVCSIDNFPEEDE